MDLKRYKKTRYQNIYKSIKNGNYVIYISNPNTSISTVEGEKIYKIEQAIKVRDNYHVKITKKIQLNSKDTFNVIWSKYIEHCEKVEKLAFETIKKKRILYDAYLNFFATKKISKINRNDITIFLANIDTTDKQKNEILKILSAFFNWCVKENILIISPTFGIKKYKIIKTEVKYWLPEHIEKILSVINNDLNSNNLQIKYNAYIIKIMILIGFTCGDRIGESRALLFNCIDNEYGKIKIKHSINYDKKDPDFLGNTKNYWSQREVDVTNKLLREIINYRDFLIKEMKFKVTDNTPLFFNYYIKKPYSDVTLRKKFNRYILKANVPKIKMKDLRHTFVALMMAEGWELYHISKIIGHSNYSTTVNKYGHIADSVKNKIANSTDKYY